MQQSILTSQQLSTSKVPAHHGSPGNAPSVQVPVIHIVDDDQEFRTAISRLLLALGYQVRCYQNAGDYLLAERHDGPGCLLLDYYMPGPSGLELQTALADSEHRLPTIFLSGRADIGIAVEALKQGAQDFLVKPVDQEKLTKAIDVALSLYPLLPNNNDTDSLLQTRYECLTERETTVLKLVVSGRLNKEIAYELGLSERTVKAHRASVMHKMQANSLAELVYMAVQLGFTPKQ